MDFTVEQLRAIAQQVCRGKATAEQESFIVAFYQKVFKQSFSRCKCQLCDAIFLIIKNIDKMSNYRLKKGIVLRQHGKPYRLTHKNLTDELAKMHLAARPGDVKFFDVVPTKQATIPFQEKKQEPVKEPIPENVDTGAHVIDEQDDIAQVQDNTLNDVIDQANKLKDLKQIIAENDIFIELRADLDTFKNFKGLKAKMLKLL